MITQIMEQNLFAAVDGQWNSNFRQRFLGVDLNQIDPVLIDSPRLELDFLVGQDTALKVLD